MKRLKNWTVRKVSGTPFWEVDEPFFWLQHYNDAWMIVVEKWFKTNFWSVPRLLWWIFNPTRYNSYVIHDKAYDQKMIYNSSSREFRLLTRKECDDMLYDWLKYEWAGFIERWAIYLGVRLWWWVAWNKN